MKLGLLLIAGLALLGSCKKPASGSFVAVASISSIDMMTHVHIFELMNQHGIPCSMEGSLSHGICVPEADSQRAKTILRQDAPIRGYWISFGKNDEFSPPENTTNALVLYKPHQDALKDSNIPAELRCVLADSDIVELSKTYPVVASFEFKRRSILAPGGSEYVGYQGKVILRNKDGREAYRNFQAWDKDEGVFVGGGAGG